MNINIPIRRILESFGKIQRIAAILSVFFLALSLSSKAQQRPNIILILADDMGYSDLGSYGGEVKTPNLDRLASSGLKYKQFYNAARCCPTRASLMTGLYPHQAGMGWMAAADLGTPAYQDNLNKTSVIIAEVLKTAGYGTYMTGKWHLTNERKIDGMVTDSWPKQRGFDRYFGIIPGGANYYTPVLYSDNKKYPAPKDFYLTDAISDTSVKYIDQHFSKSQSNPMFMYVAYTAPHWPLHALKKDIDKYKEMYKAGWDKLREQRFAKQKQIGLFSNTTQLSPRDPVIKPWDSLSEKDQNEMAMRMAIYAAQIDVMDQGIGRIVQKLKDKNQLDNTLILFLSDNGACAEFINSGESKEVNGAENTFESYRINWANLSSTPFREYKHYTNEGGIATPLIVSWPAGINKNLNNTYVSEYGHISDIMATCVDIANAKYPSQYKGNKITPLVGKSLLPHFKGQKNNRGVVYWEHEANIAMRDGKWKLVAKTAEDAEFSKNTLELFDLDADPSEMSNLSTKYPERVSAMYSSWENWAKSIGAFPLDTRNYGARMDGYKRMINGSFEEDNLGGWNVKTNAGVNGKISIDESGKISGKNAAKVSVFAPGDKPAALAMTWNFKAVKGEKYMIKVNSKASRKTSFILRFEKPNGSEKLLDQTVNTSQMLTKTSGQTIEVPANGPYQLALYFGKLNAGDEVWIDDVEMAAVKSN